MQTFKRHSFKKCIIFLDVLPSGCNEMQSWKKRLGLSDAMSFQSLVTNIFQNHLPGPLTLRVSELFFLGGRVLKIHFYVFNFEHAFVKRVVQPPTRNPWRSFPKSSQMDTQKWPFFQRRYLFTRPIIFGVSIHQFFSRVYPCPHHASQKRTCTYKVGPYSETRV